MINEIQKNESFEQNTLIATADGTLKKKITELLDKVTPIWTFNTHKKQFEISNAKAVYCGKKHIYKLTLSDGGHILCTGDTKFLLRPTMNYVENKYLSEDISIFPFKRKITKRGYWNIRRSKHKSEHIHIFKFLNPNHSTLTHDIHHINENKRDNTIQNLQALTKSEHTKITKPTWEFPKLYNICISKKELLNNIHKFDDKSECANYFNIYTDHLMYLLGYYEIDKKFKKLNPDECRKLISQVQTGKNNSYFRMSEENKRKFASKPREKNPKWLGYSDEELLKIGNDLYKLHGKLTSKIWRKHAKENKLPQTIVHRFKNWNAFLDECKNYNHNVLKREYVGFIDTYKLEIFGNNSNYVTLSRITKNIEEGIVVAA
jgi:hypothetical protein